MPASWAAHLSSHQPYSQLEEGTVRVTQRTRTLMTTKLEEAQRPPFRLGLVPEPHSPAGHLPTDWRVATRLPAATPPPLATAAADIILAAMEEAAIPAPVKPMAPSTTGTATTTRAAGRQEI